MNYNEQLEKNIEEMIKPVIEKGKGFDYLYDELNNKYRETHYPGYIYKIGLLYETNLLETNNPRQHIKYYSDAANQNYLPAIIKLSEICLENIDYELTITSLWLIQNKNSLMNDAYGKYLLAKHDLIRHILDDEKEYISNDLSLIQDSANKGCKQAIKFMKNNSNK